MVTGDPTHHVNVEGRQLATDAESVGTERLSVTESFDPVATDSWLYRYETNTNATGSEFNTATSGSGAVGGGSSEHSHIVTTGTTVDSEGTLFDEFLVHYNPLSWDNDHTARYQIDISDLTEDGFIGLGSTNYDTGNSVIAGTGIGFRFQGGDIRAWVGTADGGAIISGASTGTHDCYLEHEAGAEVRYWVDSDPQNTPDLTVSTGLPSGAVGLDRVFSASVGNPDGVDVDLLWSLAEVTQLS